MVARLIEGFESSTTPADYLGKWSAVGSQTISAAAGRYGNGTRLTSNSHLWTRTLDSQPTWVVGFALRLSAVPGTANALLSLLDGATVHCGIGITADTSLLVAFRGTVATVLGTAPAPLIPGTWYYVEGKFTIHDTTGVAVVRVNGVPVINLSGVDTRNAGSTATANVVRLSPSSSLAASADIDDLYIFDATGAQNTDFAGDCRVEQVLPSGAGATTAWTPSAGGNFQCVDDVPPNGDTDYVASSTAGQTDTYAFGDLAVASSGTVKAVQATVVARKDDAGSRSLAVVARPGSTDRVGATQGVGDSYSSFTQMWDTNPDTSAAWTVAEVNSGQWGVRLIA